MNFEEELTGYVSIGDQFPDFELNGVKNGYITKIKSSDFKGEWFLACSYPLDFTFVCPTELKAFNAAYTDFKKLGCNMFWFSIDSEYAHLKYISEIGPLHFPLVSDMDRELSEELNILSPNGMTYRSTFLVDPTGTIRHISITDNSVGRSVAEAMRLLQAFQTDGLCACDWQPGDANLEG